MTMILAAAGVASLVAGLLVMWCPVGAWAGLTPRRSHWANQASMAGALCFGGLGFGGAALLVISGADLWHGWRSQNWHPVEAVVTASRLVEVRQIRSTNPAYRADVVYRYRIDGQHFTASRLAFGNLATPHREAIEEDLRTRYSLGTTLTAYADVTSPTQAVLIPGVQPKAGIMSALGLVFVLIAGWQLTHLFRDWHGDQLFPEKRKPRTRRSSHS